MMKIRILNAGHQLLAQCRRASVGSHHRRLHGPSGDRRNVPQGADRGDPALRRPRARNHAGGVSRACRTAFFQPCDPRHDPPRRLRRIVPSRRFPVCRSCARRLRAGGFGGRAGPCRKALWARMCEGHREDGSVIEPNDPSWVALTRAAQAAKDRPLAWIEQTGGVWRTARGPAPSPRAFEHWLSLIWRDGTSAARGPLMCRRGGASGGLAKANRPRGIGWDMAGTGCASTFLRRPASPPRRRPRPDHSLQSWTWTSRPE